MLSWIPRLRIRRVFSQMVFLLVQFEQRLNQSKCLFDVFSSFGTCQHDLTRSKNKQTYFRFLQVINEAWERFRIEITEFEMFLIVVQLFQLYFEIYRATRHHILYSEFSEFYWVANTSDSLGILLCSLLAI